MSTSETSHEWLVISCYPAYAATCPHTHLDLTSLCRLYGRGEIVFVTFSIYRTCRLVHGWIASGVYRREGPLSNVACVPTPQLILPTPLLSFILSSPRLKVSPTHLHVHMLARLSSSSARCLLNTQSVVTRQGTRFKKLQTPQRRVLSSLNMSRFCNLTKMTSRKQMTTSSTPPPPPSAPPQTFVQYWLSHKELSPRYTLRWWGEMAVIFTVFGCTGSTTMFVVRPVASTMLQVRGVEIIEGGERNRIC